MAVDEKYSSIILKRLSESENPSEQIELISDDDKRFPIHRVILTAASKHFAASLGPNWNVQEGNRSGILFKGQDGEVIDSETIRMIVNYCYTGYITLTEENVQTFLAIASFYQLDLLEEKCCSFYAKILSATNSVEALMFADEYNYAELRQTALDFICDSFELVPTTEVQKLNHQLFEEILESNELKSSEELIFDQLFKWSEHGERKYVPNLLKLIRLQDIKFEILKDTVAAFYEKFNCTELILAEYNRRASNNHFDRGSRRGYSFFCLFTNYCNGRGDSIIEVGFNTKTINLKKLAEFNLPERSGFKMVLGQNKIYILGGNLNGDFYNTVSSFDLISRHEEILPEMNISRSGCTSIRFEEYIYVFGGHNNSGLLSSCERFDIKRKTWTEIESMNMARMNASAVVMNGCIYIAGGLDYRGISRALLSYDQVRNVWKEQAPMNVSRMSFALIQSNGFIYAIGRDDIIEKYDPSKNQWTEISRLDKSRYITSGINLNGEIYVINISGELRRIKIDSGNCSYFPWVHETAFKSKYGGAYFLSLN